MDQQSSGKDRSLHRKERELHRLLRGHDRLLIAFSGGVDSAFLLHRAAALLGPARILAVTACSPLRAAAETEAACALAAQLGVPHRLVHTEELSREPFRENRPDRCYHCKEELCSKLRAIAAGEPPASPVDGANRDDLAAYRPGAAAMRAAGFRSPLQEAGLTKEEIRLLSRRHGLSTWNRPAESCLATRFPYGERLEQEKIRRVERAEQLLRRLGLQREIRVRSVGDSARIEVAPGEMALVWERREAITASLRELGFLQVTLDLEGYTPGRLDRALRLTGGDPAG